MTSAVSQVATLAEENGISGMELALRWVIYDSPLKERDAVLFGASSEVQLRQNLGWIEKGSVGQSICEKMDQIWEEVKDVAPGGDLSR